MTPPPDGAVHPQQFNLRPLFLAFTSSLRDICTRSRSLYREVTGERYFEPYAKRGRRDSGEVRDVWPTVDCCTEAKGWRGGMVVRK